MDVKLSENKSSFIENGNESFDISSKCYYIVWD